MYLETYFKRINMLVTKFNSIRNAVNIMFQVSFLLGLIKFFYGFLFYFFLSINFKPLNSDFF